MEDFLKRRRKKEDAKKKTHYFSFITTKRHNNQNRHSEGGTTAETLSNYLKIPRCDLDDGQKEDALFFFHYNQTT